MSRVIQSPIALMGLQAALMQATLTFETGAYGMRPCTCRRPQPVAAPGEPAPKTTEKMLAAFDAKGVTVAITLRYARPGLSAPTYLVRPRCACQASQGRGRVGVVPYLVRARCACQAFDRDR